MIKYCLIAFLLLVGALTFKSTVCKLTIVNDPDKPSRIN